MTRVATHDGAQRFEAFDKQLKELAELDPLKEINARSSHASQVITFHLVFEYLVEKWIDYKVNGGAPVFRGIEKIGFFNKLYIAKNLGLPKEIFEVLDAVNAQRNKFAHQLTKSEVERKDIFALEKLADSIDCRGAKVSELRLMDEGREVTVSETTPSRALLLLVLHAVFGKLRNFVFYDIYQHNSRPLNC